VVAKERSITIRQAETLRFCHRKASRPLLDRNRNSNFPDNAGEGYSSFLLRSCRSHRLQQPFQPMRLRIPMKPAIDSDLKPASHSDFIPAGIPI